jgi:uncharacterized damage-inducible protein DinB
MTRDRTNDPRTDPPRIADEATALLALLDFHRATLLRKADGLDAAQLSRPLPPSTLTIGGLLKHLALVEHSWLAYRLLGQDEAEPWASVDWDADPDWEFHTAAQDDPDDLRRLLVDTQAESRRNIEEALASGGLDHRSVRTNHGEHFDLRFLLLHLIEEYARHNGHADLIRESIDGVTGE